MKAVGIVLLLFFTTLGMKRAFIARDISSEILSTRQKIELTYRNAVAMPLDEEGLKVVELEIQNLVKQDPFLKKWDRLWVKEKLKSLRGENTGPLAMGSVH